MRRRSRLETYLDLIQAVSLNGNSIDIGKQVSLPLSDVEKHLSFLASQGFIRITKQEKQRIRYELTAKGFEALEALQELTKHPLLKHMLSTEVNPQRN